MKSGFFIFFLAIVIAAHAQSSWYFNRTFGHIHQKPYSNSMSATGISCGEKLEKNPKEKLAEQEWEAVIFGDKKGFVYKGHLSETSPKCLQADYPIFFQSLELDLTELFLWGRLSDQFIDFETGR